jgi:hypothetical protein
VSIEPIAIQYLAALLRHRLAAARSDERGYSAEAVVVTALLVAAAIIVVGIIVAKIKRAASGITTQ